MTLLDGVRGEWGVRGRVRPGLLLFTKVLGCSSRTGKSSYILREVCR